MKLLDLVTGHDACVDCIWIIHYVQRDSYELYSRRFLTSLIFLYMYAAGSWGTRCKCLCPFFLREWCWNRLEVQSPYAFGSGDSSQIRLRVVC